MKGILGRTRIFFCIIICMIYGKVAQSQGRWDIKYSSIDSINSSFIGIEIRIDFKSFKADTLKESPNWMERKLLSNEDTVVLTLDGESRIYKENWKLYPDHGILREQSLISIDKQEKIQIKEVFLVAIADSAFVIEVISYDSMGEKKKQKGIVYKCNIKGILTRGD